MDTNEGEECPFNPVVRECTAATQSEGEKSLWKESVTLAERTVKAATDLIRP